MKRRIILVLFALVLAWGWVGTYHAPGLTSVAHAEELVSAPGKYSGYSPVLYDGYKLFSQYVTVRDGTKLAVDIFRPTLNGRWWTPAILWFGCIRPITGDTTPPIKPLIWLSISIRVLHSGW